MYKTIYATLLLLLLASVKVRGEGLVELNGGPLPILIINTEDGEFPSCDFAFAPEGCDGITSINHSKHGARIVLMLETDTLYDSGAYEKDLHGGTIRIRGNTSAYYNQSNPPYKINLEKKADLLCRGEAKYEDKEWVLLSSTLVKTLVGNRIAEIAGFDWVPKCCVVNLQLNNRSFGKYLLTESIKRNADCRINVDKNSGFIFEHDAYWWNETPCAETNVLGIRYKYTFKYPQPDDVSTDQVEYISGYMTKTEEAILEGSYADYIEVESFARWLLVQDIVGSYDAGGTNMFLAKNSADEMVRMIAPWDFGSVAGTDNRWATIHNWKGWIFPYLLKNNNREFDDIYAVLWDDISDRIVAETVGYLDTIKTQQFIDATLRAEANTMASWIKKRKTWIDEHICEVATGINDVPVGMKEDHSIYNLYGQKVNRSNFSDVVYLVGNKRVLMDNIR